MISVEAAHVGDVAPTAGFDDMVFGTGVDSAEEGEHRFGLVAGFAKETAIVVVGVGVVGGEEETDRFEGGDGKSKGGAVGRERTV
jgi:hypothetical protein